MERVRVCFPTGVEIETIGEEVPCNVGELKRNLFDELTMNLMSKQAEAARSLFDFTREDSTHLLSDAAGLDNSNRLTASLHLKGKLGGEHDVCGDDIHTFQALLGFCSACVAKELISVSQVAEELCNRFNQGIQAAEESTWLLPLVEAFIDVARISKNLDIILMFRRALANAIPACDSIRCELVDAPDVEFKEDVVKACIELLKLTRTLDLSDSSILLDEMTTFDDELNNESHPGVLEKLSEALQESRLQALYLGVSVPSLRHTPSSSSRMSSIVTNGYQIQVAYLDTKRSRLAHCTSI